MWPDAVLGGTAVPIVVAVAEVAAANELFNFTRSFDGVESKLVPLMVTAVPTAAIVGLKLVMLGALVPAPTIKDVLLVAEPPEVATLIGPVVAPLGTVTTNCVVEAVVTVAGVPLNWTVFWLGVVLKPVPLIVTVAPTAPLLGTKPMIEIWDDGLVEIETKFPTGSYAYVAALLCESETPTSLPRLS
jgi:hypothetical protein